MKMFHAPSLDTIKLDIDDFIAEGKPFKSLPLILAATGNSFRIDYRGVAIRQWCKDGEDRFDAAVELTENAGG